MKKKVISKNVKDKLKQYFEDNKKQNKAGTKGNC